MRDVQPELAALASDLAHVAAGTDDFAIAQRLIEMADEVRALAVQEACDSPIYDSATIFMHSVRADNMIDRHADEHIAYPTQRN